MADKNDNGHSLCEWVRDRLAAHAPLQWYLERMRLCGAEMQRGNSWRASRDRGQRGHRSDKEDSPNFSTPLDIIGQQVRHLEGRLSVWDHSAGFTSAEPERVATLTPKLVQKLAMARSWFWRWLPANHAVEKVNDLKYESIVCGYSATMWHFVDDFDPKWCARSNGIQLNLGPTPRMTNDTAISAQDPTAHEWMIVTVAMSVEEANLRFGKRLKERGRHIEGGPPMGALLASDTYLDKSLQANLVGAANSKTPGVLIHWVFRGWWTKIGVVIHQAQWKDKDQNRHESAWYVAVGKDDPETGLEDWPYGCPIFKLDGYKSLKRWCGDSVVVDMTPMQNLVNLGLRREFANAYAFGAMKILVAADRLANKNDASKFRSNKPIEIIETNQQVPPADVAHVLQLDRRDPAWESLIRTGIQAMKESGGLGGALSGEAVSHETGSGYANRVRQALMPLEPRAITTQKRLEEFYGNMVDAALRYHGEGTRRYLFVGMVGENHAGIALDVKKTKEVVNSGRILCKMKDDEFLPETVEEIKDQMYALLKAGRYTPDSPEWAIQYFLRTHREAEAGQWEAYQESQTVVSECLSGSVPTLYPDDPLLWVVWMAKAHLRCSRSRGYSMRQRQALQLTIRSAKDLQASLAAEQGATQALAGGGAIAGPIGPSSGPAQPAAVPSSPEAASPAERPVGAIA